MSLMEGNHFSSSAVDNSAVLDSSSSSTTTEKDDPAYDLSEGTPLAIVFNHRSYQQDKELSEREGTDVDVAAIEGAFYDLGFRVDKYDNPNYDKIDSVISDLQSTDEVLSCVAIFVLTHGQDNGTLYANDMPYRLDRYKRILAIFLRSM